MVPLRRRGRRPERLDAVLGTRRHTQTMSYKAVERDITGKKSGHTPLIDQIRVDTRGHGAEELQPSAKNWTPQGWEGCWERVRSCCVERGGKSGDAERPSTGRLASSSA